MKFTHFYGSRKQLRLKFGLIYSAVFLNAFVISFIISGNYESALIASFLITTIVSIFIVKNSKIRFVEINLFVFIFLASVLVALISLAGGGL